jgi:hypothetical protein
MSGPDSGAGQPVGASRLVRVCRSAAGRAAGWAGPGLCCLPAVRRAVYRQAYAYLASVITEYDRADEMSGADLYDFIGQWMVANRIPIFDITGYDAGGQPVYQPGQEA